MAGASARHSQALEAGAGTPGAGAGTPGAGAGTPGAGTAGRRRTRRERGRRGAGRPPGVRGRTGARLGAGRGVRAGEGKALPQRRRGGVGGLSLDGLGLKRLRRERLGSHGLLGGQVARAGRRGLRRDGALRRDGGLRHGGGPGRGGGDRRLPRRHLGLGLPGRDVSGSRRWPGQVRLGRCRLAEQLVPLDQRASAQGQQGYAAHADRDVDQHQLAGNDPGDQQSDRDGNEQRAEPNHGRSLSDPYRSSAPTGARARALPQRYGSHRNEARPPPACRTVPDPGHRYARPPARSARQASAAVSRLRRSGSYRSR